MAFLRKLLSQTDYLPHYHGRWFERLALDLDQHLRDPVASLEAVAAGLADCHVRCGRRLALCQRAAKICGAKNRRKLADRLDAFTAMAGWKDTPATRSVTIRGRLMPKAAGPGAKTVFVFDVAASSQLLCSVEEFTREHFRAEEGLTEGLHAEGSVVNTLCAVLFWEVIYDPSPAVDDAFRTPNQVRMCDCLLRA